MGNLPSAPDTLTSLRATQSLILAAMGNGFAALSAADATRLGVARAIFIGAPKDFNDGYLPQCHLVAEDDAVSRVGANGRIVDALRVRVTLVADYTDWWNGEQTILALRDQLWPTLLAHVRAGTSAGATLVALDPLAVATRGVGFGFLEVAGVWYRTWSATVDLRQIWAPSGGLVP